MSQPTSREQLLRRQSRIRLVAFLGVLIFTVLIILKVENMLVSFLVAFVFSYMLGPLVNYLERKNIDRVLATTVLFLGFGFGLGLTVYLTYPFISERIMALQADAPKYRAGITGLFNMLQLKFMWVKNA